MTKATVLETLRQLPNVFDTEELLQRLVFIDKVEKGLDDMANNKTVSLSDVKDHFEKKWQKL